MHIICNVSLNANPQFYFKKLICEFNKSIQQKSTPKFSRENFLWVVDRSTYFNHHFLYFFTSFCCGRCMGRLSRRTFRMVPNSTGSSVFTRSTWSQCSRSYNRNFDRQNRCKKTYFCGNRISWNRIYPAEPNKLLNNVLYLLWSSNARCFSRRMATNDDRNK